MGHCSTFSSKPEAPRRSVPPLANLLHRPEASQRAPVWHPLSSPFREEDAVLPQPLWSWQRIWSWALWAGGPEKAGRQSAANNPLGFQQGRCRIAGFVADTFLVRSVLAAQPLSPFSTWHKLAPTPSRSRSKCLEESFWPNVLHHHFTTGTLVLSDWTVLAVLDSTVLDWDSMGLDSFDRSWLEDEPATAWLSVGSGTVSSARERFDERPKAVKIEGWSGFLFLIAATCVSERQKSDLKTPHWKFWRKRDCRQKLTKLCETQSHACQPGRSVVCWRIST